MKVALIVIGVVVLLVAAFFAWLVRAAHAGGRKAYLALAARIDGVEQRLVAKQDPEPEDLERFARDRETRKVLYDALEHHGRLALFPLQYMTAEAMAEADLVLWLAHPNELGTPPDEIELMATLPAPGDAVPNRRCFVFRYRTKPPHWAAKDGWLAGVAGPFPVEGVVSSSASGTFSRFEPYDSRTPEEHVQVTYQRVIEPQRNSEGHPGNT
jgi:hypothetical protein